MQQQQQVIDKCKAVFALARQLYPHLNFDNVGIRFDLKGRAAGMACRRGGQYFMRYNRDMLTREAFDHIINNTVPHEIAHIVCFMDPRLGNNHNSGWANVCRRLGGTGARTHDEDVVHGKGTTYEYTTDRGEKVRIGDRHHRYVQGGQPLRFRKGLGTVTKECTYTIVGYQGRSLAPRAPVVPAPQPTHTAPVATVVTPKPAETPWWLKPRDAQRPLVATPTPTAVVAAPTATYAAGASKASISRSIMLSGYRSGKSYEEIIATMMAACGYDRQLARATYKANAPKIGIPVQ